MEANNIIVQAVAAYLSTALTSCNAQSGTNGTCTLDWDIVHRREYRVSWFLTAVLDATKAAL